MQLELRNLSKKFKSRVIFEQVNLSIPLQGISVIVGINGSGKSTLLEMITGFLRPSHGSIFLENIRLDKMSLGAKLGSTIGMVPQKNILVDDLSVIDNLLLYATRQELHYLDELSEKFEIQTLLRTKYKNLSFGEKVRIKIVHALLRKPKLLILDEPLSGLDPIFIKKIKLKLQAIKAMGTPILMTEHLYHEMVSIADSFYFIHDSRLHFVGTPAEFYHNDLVKKYYLGNATG